MKDLFEQHIADRQDEQPGTLERRRYWARVFSAYCHKHGLTLEQLTREQLESYLEALQWTPGPRGLPSPSTVYQGMSMLRRFLCWAVSRGLLASDPTAGWVFGRPLRREKQLLSRSQLEAIFQSPLSTPVGLRDRAILGLFAEMGLYGTDCSALNLADLDLVGYRIRQLRLSAHLAEHLHRYLKSARPALLTNPSEKALLLTRFGGRIPPATVDSVLIRHSPGNRVSPSTLHRSWLAHREAFLSRRLPES